MMGFSKSDSTVTVLFSEKYGHAVAQVTDPELYESLEPLFLTILQNEDITPSMVNRLEDHIHAQCQEAGLV